MIIWHWLRGARFLCFCSVFHAVVSLILRRDYGTILLGLLIANLKNFFAMLCKFWQQKEVQRNGLNLKGQSTVLLQENLARLSKYCSMETHIFHQLELWSINSFSNCILLVPTSPPSLKLKILRICSPS